MPYNRARLLSKYFPALCHSNFEHTPILGRPLAVYGKYDEAEPLYTYVIGIAIGEKGLCPEHPDLVVWLNNRAGLLRKCLKKCFSAMLSSVSKLNTLRLYHTVHCTQGKFSEADPLYERCQQLMEKVFSPEDPSLAITLNNGRGC